MSVQQFVSYCYLFGYLVALSFSQNHSLWWRFFVLLCYDVGLTCVSIKADLEMSIFVKTKLWSIMLKVSMVFAVWIKIFLGRTSLPSHYHSQIWNFPHQKHLHMFQRLSIVMIQEESLWENYCYYCTHSVLRVVSFCIVLHEWALQFILSEFIYMVNTARSLQQSHNVKPVIYAFIITLIEGFLVEKPLYQPK